MHSHPEHDADPGSERGKGGLWTAVAIAAVVTVIVVLHLTGVIGAGSHQSIRTTHRKVVA